MENVIVYSTPSCPYCRMTKQYLEEQNIPYQEVDVASSQKAAQEMVGKSGQLGVPVIDVGGKIIVGFNRPKINEALGIK